MAQRTDTVTRCDRSLGSMPHCKACGAPTEAVDEEGWKRDRCPACQWIDYRNPCPAVGAAILRGEEVLLSRRARDPFKGLWDLVGGFVEAGESAEEALRREALEESGLTLDDMALVDVLPGTYEDRPTLNLLYIARATGEAKAADDSEELRWFRLDDLPEELAWPHEATMLKRIAKTAQPWMNG